LHVDAAVAKELPQGGVQIDEIALEPFDASRLLDHGDVEAETGHVEEVLPLHAADVHARVWSVDREARGGRVVGRGGTHALHEIIAGARGAEGQTHVGARRDDGVGDVAPGAVTAHGHDGAGAVVDGAAREHLLVPLRGRRADVCDTDGGEGSPELRFPFGPAAFAGRGIDDDTDAGCPASPAAGPGHAGGRRHQRGARDASVLSGWKVWSPSRIHSSRKGVTSTSQSASRSVMACEWITMPPRSSSFSLNLPAISMIDVYAPSSSFMNAWYGCSTLDHSCSVTVMSTMGSPRSVAWMVMWPSPLSHSMLMSCM